ncbi:oligosaccharide flippase family protein [Candidatus Woesebacteria bacterium]|nr:oligosaccharide flippase family protein [Candidatus Woesebacteria bacterium]
MHHELKKNTVVSILSLFFQSGYSAVLGLVANLILTIVMPTKTFGIYILTLSIISFLNYFSDIGLAASLVQKKEITDDDVKTTFTVQQILILTLITLGYLLTPRIRGIYNLPANAISLYWALLAAFFFSSLKTIPSIFLERKVQFQKIVLVQVVENTLFYIVVSILALMRFDLQSFTIAVLVRSISGTALMYYLSFWKPRIGISGASLRKLLSFGLPFQTNTLLALVKDDLITLFLGSILGLEALGFIGWAKRWAEAPIRIIMDNVNRILFPIFSRLQHDKEKVGHLIEKILYNQTLLLAPIYVGALLLMHEVVLLIPKYSKWEPALPIFYLICISAFLSSFSTPFINVFNALGKVKISFLFMIYWTTMTWILVPTLSNSYGMLGFPMTLVFLSLTFVVIGIVAGRLIPFSPWQQVAPPILSSLVMGVVIYTLMHVLTGTSYLNLLIYVLAGGVTYLMMLYTVFRRNVVHEIVSLLK